MEKYYVHGMGYCTAVQTGTLTTGDFMCKAIEPIHGHMSSQDGQFACCCCKPTCETEALAVATAMEEKDKIWEKLPRRIEEKEIEVPQQKNDYDGGPFVLFFIERFIDGIQYSSH
nr:probable cadmium/zinc-transporting ATPase HMA1, chloroplastic [Ipomoea batatas]